MKTQTSDPRKPSGLDSLFHQRDVLQDFPLFLMQSFIPAPHSMGQFLGLLSPCLVPFIPKSQPL